jgi:hypothetical protein
MLNREATTMDSQLGDYIAANLHKRPDGRVAAKELIDRFRASLANNRERRLWPRWRCVDEISRKYETAIGRGGRLFVLGLSYEPAQKWAVVNGRARLVPA